MNEWMNESTVQFINTVNTVLVQYGSYRIWKMNPLEYKIDPLEYEIDPLEYEIDPLEYEIDPLRSVKN